MITTDHNIQRLKEIILNLVGHPVKLRKDVEGKSSQSKSGDAKGGGFGSGAWGLRGLIAVALAR